MAPDQYDRSAVVAGCRNAQASFSTEPCYGTGRFSQKGIARRFLPTKFFVGFVLLLMAMQFPQTTEKELHDFICKYVKYQQECIERLDKSWQNISQNETWCRGEFDGFGCWDHGAPDQHVAVPCPSYLNRSDNHQMHRYCTKYGTWLHRPNQQGVLEIWQRKDDCNPFTSGDYSAELDETVDADAPLLNSLRIIYTVGSSISLLCLVAALFILTFLRKLHCTRNYIHINLMISFIVRYLGVLIKDGVIDAHYKSAMDVPEDMALYCDSSPGLSGVLITCRLTIIIMHYAIIANYFWLLVEGVYLQMLLSFGMSEHKYFPIFMAFGWGAPWLPIVVWIALRLTYENKGCWDIFDIDSIWWVLRIPVILSITVNFVIFINIIRIIVAKLRANHMRRNDYKYRLAKSTLALIPLLGIHYIVFLAITDEVAGEQSVHRVKIAFEIVFTSIQGALIAILYCFMNGEVQAELNKVWRNWKHRHGQPRPRKSSTNTGTLITTAHSDNGHQMTTITTAHSDSGHQHGGSYLRAPNGRESALVTRSSNDYPESPDASCPLMSNGHTVVQKRTSDV